MWWQEKYKQHDINETGELYLFTQLNECEQSEARYAPAAAGPALIPAGPLQPYLD